MGGDLVLQFRIGYAPGKIHDGEVIGEWLMPANVANIALEDMNIQLLLGAQSVCNQDNIKIPWEKVARGIDPNITSGAVIQHLAKIRLRRELAGEPVPQPLKRGGGRSNVPKVSSPAGGRIGSKRARVGKAALSTATMSNEDEEEEDFDVDRASDPEESFGETRSKRVKPGGASASKKNMKDESEHEDEEERETKEKGKVMVVGTKANRKITTVSKKAKSKSGRVKDEVSPDIPVVTTEERAARRSSVNYSKLNGEDSDSSDDSNDSYDPDETYTGAGAACFKLEKTKKESDSGNIDKEDENSESAMDDEDEDGSQAASHGDDIKNDDDEDEEDEEHKTSDKEQNKQSVVLHLGRSAEAMGLLQNLENTSAISQSRDGYANMNVYSQPNPASYYSGNGNSRVELGGHGSLGTADNYSSSHNGMADMVAYSNGGFDINLLGKNYSQYPQQKYYAHNLYVPSGTGNTTDSFQSTTGVGSGQSQQVPTSPTGLGYSQAQQFVPALNTMGYDPTHQGVLSNVVTGSASAQYNTQPVLHQGYPSTYQTFATHNGILPGYGESA